MGGSGSPVALALQAPWLPFWWLFVGEAACYTTPVSSNALQPRQRVDQLQTTLAVLTAQKSSVLLSLDCFQRGILRKPLRRQAGETRRAETVVADPAKPPAHNKGWKARKAKELAEAKAQTHQPHLVEKAPKGWWSYRPPPLPPPEAPGRPLPPSGGVLPDRDGIKRYKCPQPSRPTYQPMPPPPPPRSFASPANDIAEPPAVVKEQWRPQAQDPSVWRLTKPKFLRDLEPPPFGEGLPRVI